MALLNSKINGYCRNCYFISGCQANSAEKIRKPDIYAVIPSGTGSGAFGIFVEFVYDLLFGCLGNEGNNDDC